MGLDEIARLESEEALAPGPTGGVLDYHAVCAFDGIHYLQLCASVMPEQTRLVLTVAPRGPPVPIPRLTRNQWHEDQKALYNIRIATAPVYLRRFYAIVNETLLDRERPQLRSGESPYTPRSWLFLPPQHPFDRRTRAALTVGRDLAESEFKRTKNIAPLHGSDPPSKLYACILPCLFDEYSARHQAAEIKDVFHYGTLTMPRRPRSPEMADRLDHPWLQRRWKKFQT